MPTSTPASRPRPGGGFNQQLGQFNDEHLEENAMTQAMQQKATSQQAASPTSAQAAAAAQQQAAAKQVQPREVGSFKDELVTRPARDILKGIASFFDINQLLGIQATDTPEEQMKKKQLHQRWQKLDQEQQQVAKEKYQRELKKKQQEEQEQQMKKQKEAEAQQQTIAAPSSPKKGPVGPGSKKQKAASKMELDRKTLGGPSGAH